MNLSELKERGGFVDPSPVKKSIEWKDDKGEVQTGDVFVIRQPFGAVERHIMSRGESDDRAQLANMVHLCIRLGEDAAEQLSYDQAYALSPSIAWAMVAVIDEVNAPRTVAR